MEILIIHPGGLGDVILSLPAVALLRKRYPSARITAAGNLDHLVPVMSGYAEKIHSISTLPLHRLYAHAAPTEADVRFWRFFDLIVSWTGGGDPAFIQKFKEIHPNVRVATWKPDPGEPKHVSQLFVDSLDLGIDPKTAAAPTPVLLGPELCADGKQWLIARGWNGRDPLTALHPGAGSKAKRWPVSRFTQIAQHLVFQEKRKLLIIEGSAERGLSGQIAPGIPANDVMVFDAMSLNLLAAVVAQCDLFIGNDSGVAHLAAALKVRCIVLFGPTLPQHWAPLGRNVAILWNTRGCKGCASAGNAHTCLRNIAVEDVIRKMRFEIRD